MTEASAQYGMAGALLFCEAAGLGSCLMDSLKIAMNNKRAIKSRLNVPCRFRILSVLAVGYPEEKILNIPGVSVMRTGWNGRGTVE
jgi:nitroreductase